MKDALRVVRMTDAVDGEVWNRCGFAEMRRYGIGSISNNGQGPCGPLVCGLRHAWYFAGANVAHFALVLPARYLYEGLATTFPVRPVLRWTTVDTGLGEHDSNATA